MPAKRKNDRIRRSSFYNPQFINSFSKDHQLSLTGYIAYNPVGEDYIHNSHVTPTNFLITKKEEYIFTVERWGRHHFKQVIKLASPIIGHLTFTSRYDQTEV